MSRSQAIVSAAWCPSVRVPWCLDAPMSLCASILKFNVVPGRYFSVSNLQVSRLIWCANVPDSTCPSVTWCLQRSYLLAVREAWCPVSWSLHLSLSWIYGLSVNLSLCPGASGSTILSYTASALFSTKDSCLSSAVCRTLSRQSRPRSSGKCLSDHG